MVARLFDGRSMSIQIGVYIEWYMKACEV